MKIDENSQRYLVRLMKKNIEFLSMSIEKYEQLSSKMNSNKKLDKVDYVKLLEVSDYCIQLCHALDIDFGKLKHYLKAYEGYEKESLIKKFIIDTALTAKKY